LCALQCVVVIWFVKWKSSFVIPFHNLTTKIKL
jgi:hypothetical protein